MKDIGDRFKSNYEDRQRQYLTRRTPIIVRVDGRAFHTLTRGFNKPFDTIIDEAMDNATRAILDDAQGCKLAYRQSDEISLFLTDWDTHQTGAWFDGCQQKIVTAAATDATVGFNETMAKWNRVERGRFDGRAFNVPVDEVANYFLWRAKDWNRNSVTMYAQAHFSHKQLHGKSISDMHQMLHDIDRNWAIDLTLGQKNGTFYSRTALGTDAWAISHESDSYHEINALVSKVMPCSKE